MKNVKEILENNFVQIAIVLGGVAITLINGWIALKLTPVVQDIHSLTTRVSAVEINQSNTVSKDEFQLLFSDVRDIKVDVRTLLNR